MEVRRNRLVLSKGGANSEHLGEVPSPERAREEPESTGAFGIRGKTVRTCGADGSRHRRDQELRKHVDRRNPMTEGGNDPL